MADNLAKLINKEAAIRSVNLKTNDLKTNEVTVANQSRKITIDLRMKRPPHQIQLIREFVEVIRKSDRELGGYAHFMPDIEMCAAQFTSCPSLVEGYNNDGKCDAIKPKPNAAKSKSTAAKPNSNVVKSKSNAVRRKSNAIKPEVIKPILSKSSVSKHNIVKHSYAISALASIGNYDLMRY